MNNFETLMWEMHNMRKVTEEGQNVSHEQRKKTAEDLINKLLSGSFMWYASSILATIYNHIYISEESRGIRWTIRRVRVQGCSNTVACNFWPSLF